MDFRSFFHDARQAASRLRLMQERDRAERERLESPRVNRYDAHVRGNGVDHGSQLDAYLDKHRDAMREREERAALATIQCALDAEDAVFVSLGPRYADALLYHYLEGLTWEETAGKMWYKSKTTAKESTWTALDWLDSFYTIEHDKDGTPHLLPLQEEEEREEG